MTSVGELRLSRKPDFKGEARGEKHGKHRQAQCKKERKGGRETSWKKTCWFHHRHSKRAQSGCFTEIDSRYLGLLQTPSRSEDACRRLAEPWDNEAWDETTVKRDWRNLRQTVGRLVLSEPGSYTNCSGGRLFQMSGGWEESGGGPCQEANGAEQGRKYSGHNETDDNKAEDGEMAVTEMDIQGSRLNTYHLSNSKNCSTKSFCKTKQIYSAKPVNLANFGLNKTPHYESLCLSSFPPPRPLFPLFIPEILLKFSELDSQCESVPGGSFCLYVWGIVCDAPIHILWAIFDLVTERRAENRGFFSPS
ncbi:GTPase-activating protein NEL1 [Dissostichus eleginoides]|uniref:GTPase-activating protein NEL1 n=1 Tax=Dissostichus eleginoides TaxID=100907 RepID=A0AAD9BMV2_DISEL|nr:GTPase-activating protein NEL1 [Dissostichus eleginoides]